MTLTAKQARPISKQEKERFMLLLSPLRHRLVHFARAMAGDYEEARDLVSDTVLAALERFDHLEDPEAFLSYLFTIATRLHRRRRWRGRLFDSYDEERAHQRRDLGPPPDVSADVQLLYAALGQLPERLREAVALFEISGLSLEEIKEIQGGTLSSVKMRLVRGRQKLAELLGAGPASREKERSERKTNDAAQETNHFLIYSESNG